MKKSILLFLLFLLIPVCSWGTPVTVYFDPSDSIVNIGDNFSVDLKADIPEPVLGWGLDVSFDPSILAMTGDPIIGSDWQTSPFPPPLSNPDGDGLAGLAFPLPVSGNDILLATLSFDALALGTSPLVASFTPGDLTEGFPLVLPGSFAEVVFIDGSVSPVPEPATILLLVSGMASMGVFGRKTFRKSKI